MLLTILIETTACPVSSPAVFSSYTSSAFSTPLSRLLSSYLLIPLFRFLLLLLYICLFYLIFILFRPDVAGMLDWALVGMYPETSSQTTCQGIFGHSRLNSLSHCGLILASEEKAASTTTKSILLLVLPLLLILLQDKRGDLCNRGEYRSVRVLGFNWSPRTGGSWVRSRLKGIRERKRSCPAFDIRTLTAALIAVQGVGTVRLPSGDCSSSS